MPYQRLWLLENRVCYIAFNNDITLDDISFISGEHEKWLKTTKSSADVHYILDTSQMVTYPTNVAAIKRHLSGRMQRTGWMLFVTDDYFVKHLGEIFGKMLNFKVKAVKSALEGYQFLQAMDEVPVPDAWVDTGDTMPVRRS